MTGAIGTAMGLPTLFNSAQDVGRGLTAPPSSQQRSVRAPALSAPARPTRAERLAAARSNSRGSAQAALIRSGPSGSRPSGGVTGSPRFTPRPSGAGKSRPSAPKPRPSAPNPQTPETPVAEPAPAPPPAPQTETRELASSPPPPAVPTQPPSPATEPDRSKKRKGDSDDDRDRSKWKDRERNREREHDSRKSDRDEDELTEAPGVGSLSAAESTPPAPPAELDDEVDADEADADEDWRGDRHEGQRGDRDEGQHDKDRGTKRRG